jgi:hypothetical protein
MHMLIACCPLSTIFNRQVLFLQLLLSIYSYAALPIAWFSPPTILLIAKSSSTAPALHIRSCPMYSLLLPLSNLTDSQVLFLQLLPSIYGIAALPILRLLLHLLPLCLYPVPTLYDITDSQVLVHSSCSPQMALLLAIVCCSPSLISLIAKPPSTAPALHLGYCCPANSLLLETLYL